jgi:poly(3-hydroxybutyrate) depolymerase
MRLTLLRLLCAAAPIAAAFGIACSSTETSTPNANAGDGGADATPAPTGPQDIPVVALESDPAVDCPSKFQGTAPKEGLNTGFDASGQQREFVLLLPDDTSTPRPLFVGFNGTGEDGEAFASRAKLADFAAKGFIVLAPSSNGNGETWPIWDSLRQPGKENDPNPDLEYFDSLVKCVAGHHPIDKNRIYIGGHSAGGIFTNHVLQRRSELLAGGIPGSGVFSLTSPEPKAKLDAMFVIVTWGGDNDKYSGNAGGVSVGGFNFVSEASLASQYYDSEEKVAEINCRGNDLGHAWLSGLNGWFADQLLAHPKGWSGKGQPDLVPAVPSTGKAKCQDEPYAGPEVIDVVCADSSKEGCKEVCQLMGDCAVENGTVGPVLAQQLEQIGFSGTKNSNCGGCTAKCETTATTAADTAALTCFKERQATAECAQGINGAYPFIEAVNICCDGRADSKYCVEICTAIKTSSSAAQFFSTCNAIVP